MTNKPKINGGEVFKKTMNLVSPEVNNFVQSKIKSLKLDDRLESLLLELPEKRGGSNIMRPALTYLIHKAYGGQENLQTMLPALAVSELNNYTCYLDNWILDDKSNIGEDKEKIRQVTIASQMIRDLTQVVIEESDFSNNQKRDISKQLARTTLKCYEGQFADLHMTVDYLDKYFSEEEYLKAYKRKSELQSGCLFGLSGEIGTILAGIEKEQRMLSRNLCKTLGTGLHICNDLGDFALLTNSDGSFKLYQDQMADIKNGRMSHPIYHVLNHGTDEEIKSLKNMVGNKNATEQDKLRASKAIITSGAFNEVKKVLNETYRDYKNLVHQLPVCEERAALSSVGKVMRYNKYMTALKKIGV